MDTRPLLDAASELYIAGLIAGTQLGHTYHSGHELQPVSLASGPGVGISNGMVSHDMLAEICDEWLAEVELEGEGEGQAHGPRRPDCS
jgi:hypothetical protein